MCCFYLKKLSFVTGENILAKDGNKESRGIQRKAFSIFCACLLVLSCIVVAYVAGVMSGRASANKARSVQGVGASAPSLDAEGREGEKNSILLAEELEYARVLRSDTPQRKSATSTRQEKGADSQVKNQVQQNAVSDAMRQQNDSSSLAGTGQIGSSASQSPVAVVPGTNPQSSLPAMFDYVFQVAAMRNEESVDALRQRLEGRGLRTRMQREGKMFLVLVMLRGDEARATEVVQILDSMRLGKPMIRGRKPVIQ